MPMLPPSYTTNPMRVARLQENYNAGVEREKIPAEVREKLDLLILNVPQAHLSELMKNAAAAAAATLKGKKTAAA